MSSRHLVDPELLALLDAQPHFELSFAMLPDLRRMIAAQIAALPRPLDGPVTVTEIIVPPSADTPAVRMLAYVPRGHDHVLPAILHIHGGGYIIGTPEMNDAENRSLAVDLKCAIFSVDYRLAPETPHPGPLHDCYAALEYLHTQAKELGIDPTRIGIKGESAGGGLAASLCLLARDRGRLPVAFQHLIYPMLDDRTCIDPAPHPLIGEFIWTRPHNLFGWQALLGVAPGHPDVPAYAAAARAQTLEGLPPCFLAVGTLDLFLEENLDYGRRLIRHGVPVEIHVYPGAFHGFQMNPDARVSVDAERDSRASLRRALMVGQERTAT